MYNKLSDKLYRKLYTIFLIKFFTISSIFICIAFFIFYLLFGRMLPTEYQIPIFIFGNAILYVRHFKSEFKRFSAGIINRKITIYRNKEKKVSEELHDELLGDFVGAVGNFTKIIEGGAVAENYYDDRDKKISQLQSKSAQYERKQLFLENFYFQHCVEKPMKQQML